MLKIIEIYLTMAIKLIDGSEFLHIPKTGGIWVSNALKKCGLVAGKKGPQHSDYTYNLLNPVFTGTDHLRRAAKMGVNKLVSRGLGGKETFRFCFVRHPLAWYESFWRYMKSKSWDGWGEVNSAILWNPVAPLYELADEDFNSFIFKVLKARPGFVTELFYSFTKPGISMIGKNENLTENFISILKEVGTEFDEDTVRNFERENVSTIAKSEIEWDSKLKKQLMQVELPALIHFDYLTEEEKFEFNLGSSYLASPFIIS